MRFPVIHKIVIITPKCKMLASGWHIDLGTSSVKIIVFAVEPAIKSI